MVFNIVWNQWQLCQHIQTPMNNIMEHFRIIQISNLHKVPVDLQPLHQDLELIPWDKTHILEDSKKVFSWTNPSDIEFLGNVYVAYFKRKGIHQFFLFWHDLSDVGSDAAVGKEAEDALVEAEVLSGFEV